MNGTLPMGDGTQTPEEFVRAQSASTGLPERMCRANMKKNALRAGGDAQHPDLADARALDFDVLTSGHGEERGVPISYQAQSPVLGLVLPSNSPGVHTLWLPIIPLQIGLVLKPGPQEPWTPYPHGGGVLRRPVFRAKRSPFIRAQADVGAAVLEHCARSLIFGGTATVERYRGNPRVQAHGPGFSKILLGRRSGRSVGELSRCHGRQRLPQQRPRAASIARGSGRAAIRATSPMPLAQRLAAVRPLPPDHPDASLAAFTVPGVAEAISQAIDGDLQTPGVTDVTARYRDGDALVKQGRADYLLPTVLHADSPGRRRRQEGIHVSVRYAWSNAREAQMLEAIGPTLVCTAITCNDALSRPAARRRAYRPSESWARFRPRSSTGCSRTRATSWSSCSVPGPFKRHPCCNQCTSHKSQVTKWSVFVTSVLVTCDL